MGFTHPRAICPNCGGKIHTHNQNLRRRTGTTCPLCGIALTGATTPGGGRAILAPPKRTVAETTGETHEEER